MLTCPKCVRPLVHTQNETGPFWRCHTCEGRAVSVLLLRRTIVKDYIALLWLRVRKGQGVPGCSCPACNSPMSEVSRSSDVKAPNLDICRVCKLVWFDPKEYEEVMSLPLRELSQEEREFINLHEAELVREMRIPEWSIEGPEEAWKLLPALFGLPVEYEETLFQRAPWLTRGLVAALVIIFGCFIRSLDRLIQDFGLISDEPWRYGGLTFLTSFFIHGGIWHLACNIYFLYTFGDNVEDYLGKRRYLLLLLLATLASGVLHVVMDSKSEVPFIGSSCVISGLMAFYVLRFPNAEMGVVLLLRRIRWFRMPAFEAFMVWIVLQAIGCRFQLAGFANVSVLAHFGSAAVGFLFWLIWRRG